MNILDALENYRVSLIHDQKVFNLISLISLIGPISTNEINERLDNLSADNNKILINLYKSGMLISGGHEQWSVSPLGTLILSKIGVTQMSSFETAKNVLGEDLSYDWLLRLINDEKDLRTSSLAYDRIRIVEWVSRKTDILRKDTIKKSILTDLYFSTKREFYAFDAETFYDVFSIYNKKTNIDFNEFSNNYNLCKQRVTISNKFISTGKIDASENLKSVIYLTFFRLLSSLASRSLDVGMQSALSNIENITAVWKTLLKQDNNLSNVCSRYIFENSNIKSCDDFPKVLIKYIQSDIAADEQYDFDKIRKISNDNHSVK